MKDRALTNLRKWVCLIISVFLYYLIHEGSHWMVASHYGAFEKIQFLGVGVQVVIREALLSHRQLAIFCLVGSLASLTAGYLLVMFTGKIVCVKSRYFKATGFYSTLILLLLDPLYLSVLYKFFGGGDMNGILLFGIAEPIVQVIYGIIGIGNLTVFIKFVLPKYKMAFSED